MARIITIAGFGTPSEVFRQQVAAIVDNSHEVVCIKWLIEKGPQPLMDMLDSRDGKKVIVNVAEQVIAFLEDAQNAHQDVYFVSQLQGSRILEEGLSMVKNINRISTKIEHIMLAPEIDHSEWQSIGKFATAAAVAGLAGLALAASRNKKGLATAALGIIGSAMIARKETVTEKLSLDDGEVAKFVEIDRHLFLNPESDQFDEVSEHIKGGTYYKGEHDPKDIAALHGEHLEQKFRYQKWMRTNVKTKSEIINEIIGN